MTRAEKEVAKKKLGAAIEKIRKKKKWTLRQVEANCSLDNSKIAKIEDGMINISFTTFVEISRGLEVTPADLIHGVFGTKEF